MILLKGLQNIGNNKVFDRVIDSVEKYKPSGHLQKGLV